MGPPVTPGGLRWCEGTQKEETITPGYQGLHPHHARLVRWRLSAGFKVQLTSNFIASDHPQRTILLHHFLSQTGKLVGLPADAVCGRIRTCCRTGSFALSAERQQAAADTSLTNGCGSRRRVEGGWIQRAACAQDSLDDSQFE